MRLHLSASLACALVWSCGSASSGDLVGDGVVGTGGVNAGSGAVGGFALGGASTGAGGKASSGGAPSSSGGAPAQGGATGSSGGAPASGGASESGGAAPAGGVTGAGGTLATGGAGQDTGGAGQDTGGAGGAGGAGQDTGGAGGAPVDAGGGGRDGSAGEDGGATRCFAGHYSGLLTGLYTSNTGTNLIFVDVAFTIDDSGVASGTFKGRGNNMARADLDGTVDCTTGDLTLDIVNGTYPGQGSDGPQRFTGTLTATYDAADHFPDGAWTMSEPRSQNGGVGTWSAF